jgi:hypothetical protein
MEPPEADRILEKLAAWHVRINRHLFLGSSSHDYKGWQVQNMPMGWQAKDQSSCGSSSKAVSWQNSFS